MRKSILLILLMVGSFCWLSAKSPLGTKKNPVKMYFVPSMEAGKVVTSGKKISDLLFQKTGYYFKTAVPTSYASVVEALGTDEADIAWLPTFAYIMAHDINGAEVELTTVRNGLKSYKGQFISRVDSGINEINDINDKIIAYTDAASTSGYIYPSAILKQNNIEPKRYIFAGGHPQAIIAVYEKNADVACTFWSPEHEGIPQDARKYVMETYPDIFTATKVIGFTDWIPNDTVTFRKEFPKDMKDKIVNAILDISLTEEGKAVFSDLYSVDGFTKSSDADYEVVRKALRSLGLEANQLVN
ncbi:MAG: phosphate/phosphite/phosphonate ABC transporter substrate-binding protein [Candidatus Cloacimonetes bacterium]|nr:phosphate/phosphite/phosphonate ABC transporter substrate-binding protein [Candidatus Cloacimonadota bacterium]